MGLERIATINEPSFVQPGDGGNFGRVVKMHGNTMVISGTDITATPAAQARVFFYQRGNDGTWSLKQTVLGSDLTDQAGAVQFGAQLAICENYVAIGQANNGTTLNVPGVVYIFVRGNDGTWTLKQTFTGDENNDQFGFGLSMSGNNLLIGAPSGGGGQEGAVYFYVRGNDGVYSRLRKIIGPAASSEFGGISLGISGNFATIGASAFGGAGRIYFYTRDNNGDWEQIAFDDGTAASGLGSVGVHNHGNYAIAATAAGGVNGAGYFRTYIRNNSGELRVTSEIDTPDTTLGTGPVGIYGNFAYSLYPQDPDDNTNSLINFYVRDAEGNLTLKDTASVIAADSIADQNNSSDIYGTYIAVGGPAANTLLGIVHVYQYKN